MSNIDFSTGKNSFTCHVPIFAVELRQGPLGLSDGFIPDHNIHILDSEVFDFGPEKARPVPPGLEDDGRPWCAGQQR